MRPRSASPEVTLGAVEVVASSGEGASSLLATRRAYLALSLTPRQRRQQSLEALLKQLTVLAQQNPALMIFEDAHWTDPTSLELLGMVVNLIETSPVLLIVTFRPEFEPPWIGRPHVTALTLNRLPQRNIAAMIDHIAGNKLLAADIRQDIIERTDGIPLFVEEMTKAVLEARSEGDPVEHRPLAARFSQDGRVAALAFRSDVLWYLGRPEAAIVDALQAIEYARELGQAPTLMYALFNAAAVVPLYCGKFAWANSLIDELLALADEKDARFWKAQGTVLKGLVFAQTGEARAAITTIETGLAARRVIGATAVLPCYLCELASAYAETGNINEAGRCIVEAVKAMETTKERQFEAEICRVAGEIALRSPQPDLDAVHAHFERALKVARARQAKSLELRAAMSLARLLRDQGKRDEARELLAPVYGWFTEGFDTRDLEEAKTLLDELGL